MKTIKLTVATTLIAAVISVTAIERPKVNFVPVKAGQAVVSISNENAAYFELSIYSENGEMVYYKQTNELQKEYSKVYDFKNLADGNYVLSLKVNDTKVTNDFEIKGNDIRVGRNKISFDPYFSFDNNELKFSYLNFDQENLTLNIYNQEGLVFESKLGREFNVVKGYDLSKLKDGTYKIVLNSPFREFSYNFEK
jgi:hypothetical protein